MMHAAKACNGSTLEGVAEGGAAEGADEGARPGRAVGGTPEGGACRRVLAKVHGRSGRTTDTRSPEEVPLATDGGGVMQDVTLKHVGQDWRANRGCAVPWAARQMGG